MTATAREPSPTSVPCGPWRYVFLAVGLRLALFAGWMLTHRGDWNLFVTISDAGSFLQVARCIVGLADVGSLTYYDTRVMPGWPLLIGPGLRLLPAIVWLPALTSVMTGLSVWLFHKLSKDGFLTLLFAVAPPVWLLVGVQGMAESAYFAAGLGAVLCLRNGMCVRAGLLGGFMCLLKPHGIFLAGGLALAALVCNGKSGVRGLLRVAAGGFVAPLVLFVVNTRLYGDPLRQFHTYGDDLVKLNIPAESAARLGGAEGAWAPPFSALVRTPLLLDVPLWKVLYIHAHALLLLAFMAWVAVAWLKENKRASSVETIALRCWVLGAGAAVLCAGPYWGFYSFDRYCIWLLPAACLLAKPLLPRGRVLPVIAALASVLMAGGVLLLR